MVRMGRILPNTTTENIHDASPDILGLLETNVHNLFTAALGMPIVSAEREGDDAGHCC